MSKLRNILVLFFVTVYQYLSKTANSMPEFVCTFAVGLYVYKKYRFYLQYSTVETYSESLNLEF